MSGSWPNVSGEWPLVGRDEVVAGTAAGLRDGRGTVLAGPAGVGKTRVLDGVLATPSATASGPVVRCVATAAAGRIPFGALARLLPTGADPGSRAALFRAAHRELTAGGTRDVLLAVDDAHLLDDAGLALVQHLAAAGGVVPLLTARVDPTGPPGPGLRAVLDLQRALELGWTPIDPLPRAGVAALLTRVLGGPVEESTCIRLADQAGGDLVLLREVLAATTAAGRLTRADGSWRLVGDLVASRRLDLLVAERMGRLPAAVMAAAGAVAVTEPVEPALLADQVGTAALAAAEAAGLVRAVTEDGRAVVRCAHPLYGEVLRRAVPAVTRLEIEAAVAGALLRRPDRSPDEELWIACRRPEQADPATLLRAARRASALLDHELAGRLALAAGPDPATLRFAAEEYLWLGDLDRADALLDRSLATATDDAERAEIVVAVARRELLGRGRVRHAVELVDRLPETPQTVSVRVAAALNRGEVGLADRLLRPYEQEGRTLPAVLLASRTMTDLNGGRPARAVERCRRLRAAVAPDDRAAVGTVLDSGYRSALQLAGELAEAEALSTAAYEEAVRAGADHRRAMAAGHLARVRRDRGDLPGAVVLLAEAVGLLERAPSPMGPSAVAQMLAMLASTLALSGDPAAAGAVVARLDRAALGEIDVVSMRMVPGQVAAAAGDLGRGLAVAAGTAAWTRARAAGTAEVQALLYYVDYATARSAAPVVPLPEWLLPRLRVLAAEPGAGRVLGRSAVVAGALAGGRPDELLEVAAVLIADGQLLRAAELAATAGRRARQQRREATLLRAAELSAELRGRGVVAATPLLRAAGGAGALTAREREIALLAAEGLSNRAIADRLGVSPRTVENHLYRAGTKLGVRGRAELRAALRPGQGLRPLHSSS